MSDALSPKTIEWPTPIRALSAWAIAAAIDAYPEHIESCNECANPQGADKTMDQYVYVWPAHALVSNDGQHVRGGGRHEGTPYSRGIGPWLIRRAIARWRRKVGIPGKPGHYSIRDELRRELAKIHSARF